MDLALVEALQAKSPRVLVVGDVMLDRYTWGVAERVSPEAPVLVLRVDSEEVRLGGAASVAMLLRGLGAEVDLAGVVGVDAGATVLRRLFEDAGIGAEFIREDASRPTTVKERFLGRPEHRIAGHLLRVDHESRQPLSPELELQIASAITAQIGQYQAILIPDYGKGVCTPLLLQSLIAAARAKGIPVLIDPERRKDFAKYQGATLLKPNRTAAALAAGSPIGTVEEAWEAAGKICKDYGVATAVITLDRDGMAWQGASGNRGHVKTSATHLRDITGAGDMSHAMLGYCMAAQLPLDQAVELANLAAGLEVERAGVELVTWPEISQSLASTNSHFTRGIVSRGELETLVQSYRAQKKRIVFTNGCFDLLHVGHVAYLQEAARLGDLLIVAINADSSVRKLKGADRPVIAQEQRAAMLAALSCVTHVVIFEEPTPLALIEALRPDVLVKGGTYTTDQIVGHDIVAAYGGTVCVTGMTPGVSTTQLVRRIVQTSVPAPHFRADAA